MSDTPPIILVVEDDNIVRMLIVDVLEELGFKVLEADGSEQALETLKDPALRIDLMMTDVGLPVMDGRELAKQARTYEPRKGKSLKDKDCDPLLIDFVGTIDGVAFEGGSAEDFAFVLGQGRMLPEFEDAARGLKAGDRLIVEGTDKVQPDDKVKPVAVAAKK